MQQSKMAANIWACLLGWLVPGAGHIYLGRRGRGLVLLTAAVALFSLGVWLDSRLEIHTGLDDPLALLLSLAQVASGLPYFVARGLGFDAGNVKSPTYEYGNTFTAVAGLLNILIILDAHDIAVGRKK